MTTFIRDLNRLNAMLLDELDGRPIDRHEAHRLATRLVADCPTIAPTLGRIGARMTAPAGDSRLPL